MEEFKDYYQILGIEPNATEKDIKKARQRLARRYHCDAHPEWSEEEKRRGTEKMAEINGICDILLNSEQRKSYDRMYQREKERRKAKEAQATAGSASTPTSPFTKEDLEFWEQLNRETARRRAEERRAEEERRAAAARRRQAAYYRREMEARARRTTAKRVVVSALLFVVLGITKPWEMFIPETPNNPDIESSELTGLVDAYAEEQQLTINRYYTIESGDWLSVMAERANCTQEEIKNLNNMGNTSVIAGNSIILPYHINNDEISEYTTQIPYNYEKLEDIAKAYQTDVESLRQLNPENIAEVDEGSYAFIGDTINVPTFKDYQYGTQKTK